MTASITSIVAVVVMIGMVLIFLTFSIISNHKSNRSGGRGKTSGARIILGETLSYEHRKSMEQEEFARRVMLRNKTFDLYEQVRRNAESAIVAKSADSVEAVKSADSVETSAGPDIDKTFGSFSANTILS